MHTNIEERNMRIYLMVLIAVIGTISRKQLSALEILSSSALENLEAIKALLPSECLGIIGRTYF